MGIAIPEDAKGVNKKDRKRCWTCGEAVSYPDPARKLRPLPNRGRIWARLVKTFLYLSCQTQGPGCRSSRPAVNILFQVWSYHDWAPSYANETIVTAWKKKSKTRVWYGTEEGLIHWQTPSLAWVLSVQHYSIYLKQVSILQSPCLYFAIWLLKEHPKPFYSLMHYIWSKLPAQS